MSFHAPPQVLLVESDAHDRGLMVEALGGSAPEHLHFVNDGPEAMAYLRQMEPYSLAEAPGLIILDLPAGRESHESVLKEVKEDPRLRRIPVIVFTDPSDEQDYSPTKPELKANCYLCKPLDPAHFLSVLKAVRKFWIDIVQLPDA